MKHWLFPLLIAASFPLTAATALQVRVGIASDNGRHGAFVEGLAPGTPGLEDAIARLLDCRVERSLGGFRCRDRTVVAGLEFSGRLNFAPLMRLPEMLHATAAVLVPASPLTAVSVLTRQPPGWWTARTEFSGAPPVDSPVSYRLGFSWIVLLTDLTPLPILLYWLIRRPEPRWGFAAAMSVWILWLASSGSLGLDSFFWAAPSVEGAFLRCLSWAPLGLLIVAQASWMGMPLLKGVWIPMAALVLLRPRSANWMTFGEGALADLISLALLALVAGPMLMRGRNGAPLPESLTIALHRRGLLSSRQDIRLDQPPAEGSATTPKLGHMVAIPSVWLKRLSGETLENAVLLGCLRARFAPVTAVLASLVAIWIMLILPAQRLPLLIAVAPFAACAGYSWFERRWDSRTAEEAIRLGVAPEAARTALTAIQPEWGEAALRVAARLPA